MTATLRLALLLTVLGIDALDAQVTLLIGEPFGTFGAFNPTGHAAIYLPRVCAETPTRLRLCQPGESGVVISRYHKIAGFDWLAMPLTPFLYAVEHNQDIPASADAATVLRLRDNYRRTHLTHLAPDGPSGATPTGNWIQLVGAAYDRSIYGFTIETSLEDDKRLVELLNSRPNQSRFNLFYRNCADFARRILNFYYPHALKRSLIADLGISTPKQSAKALVNYSRRKELAISHFTIPQVPGSPPSTKLRGVSESLVRSKKYAVPLLFVQPWVAVSAVTAYLVSGRFDPVRASKTTICDPATVQACVQPSEDRLSAKSDPARDGG